MPVDNDSLSGQAVLELDNYRVTNPGTNGRTGEAAVDSNHHVFYTIG